MPPELTERLVVTIGSYTHRTTVGVMGSRSLIPVGADHRRQAGSPRATTSTSSWNWTPAPRHVELPVDLAEALSKDDAACRFFDGLSASQKKWHVQSVESAKTPETRQRRIGTSMEMLRQRQAR